jgi:hypothetical protein
LGLQRGWTTAVGAIRSNHYVVVVSAKE